MEALIAYALSQVSLGERLRHRLAALQQDLDVRAARRKVYDRTFQELNALSDRDLADIGLSRMQIRDLAHKAAFEA